MLPTMTPPSDLKKPHFLSRLLPKRLNHKKSACQLTISAPLETTVSRPSFSTEAATISTPSARPRRKSLMGANSLSLPRRFPVSPVAHDSVVYTPYKQVSRAGSPVSTPGESESDRLSFDELIDTRAQDVTIKFSLTPMVAK
ncbi:hypothetical protein H4R34_002033 [Dimargaris verticillata]|uniref:Uncharacterized protein n=1 Tax=Dimargaris verticillata TaxID=2761393 RepID=A0A9W8EDY0_9FUNG|nr:hypothetical protein H4R34_002033 [Dimargaris verticillata]